MRQTITPPNSVEMWRVNDFCKAFGIGRTLFYQEVKAGKIQIVKVGARTLIPKIAAYKWAQTKIEESR